MDLTQKCPNGPVQIWTYKIVAAAAKPRVVSVSNMVSKRCSMRTDSAPRQDHGIGATVIKIWSELEDNLS